MRINQQSILDTKQSLLLENLWEHAMCECASVSATISELGGCLKKLLVVWENTVLFSATWTTPSSFCRSSFNTNHTITEINQDLARIRNWCFNNQFLLNPDKTKLLVCDSKQMAAEIVNFQLSPLGKQLTLLEAARDLGIILDTVSKFQWSCHGNCHFLYVAIRWGISRQTLLW